MVLELTAAGVDKARGWPGWQKPPSTTAVSQWLRETARMTCRCLS